MTQVDIKQNNLIDSRNQALFNKIINLENIKVNVYRDLKKGLPYWSINFDIQRDIANIFAGKRINDINAFTHELLHIIQEKNGNHSHQTLPILVGLNSSPFRVIFATELTTHINNVILHHRMLPDYLKLGFPRNKFVFDYYRRIKLKYYKHLKFNLTKDSKIDRIALSLFLQFYFAYRFHPNRFVKLYYNRTIINKYKTIHSDLVNSLENLCDDWDNNTLKLNIDFFNGLIRELENWKKSNNYC